MTKSDDVNILMRSIMLSQQRYFESRVAQFNVTRSQAQTLGFIQEHPGVNQRQIADHFSHKEASVSGLLRNLEKTGYIEKQINVGSQDRSKKIYLTATGQLLAQTLRAAFEATNGQIIEGLDEKEVDTLIALLTKIRAHQADAETKKSDSDQ